jgi:hypothetical protein
MQLFITFTVVFLQNIIKTYAVSPGGLNEAITQLQEIKTWCYAFLSIGVFIYLMYNVMLALLDRKQWSDVLISVGYVALAGAINVIGEWAWHIWGN